jgi:hypothetical protein
VPKDSIASATWRYFWRQSAVCVANYYPPHWWENDVFRITRDGYWIEYEIKTSLSDFKADAAKTKVWRGETVNKHQLLASGDLRGPSRFFFVVPAVLDVDCPAWAGLIRVSKLSRGLSKNICKPATKLHSAKAGPEALHLAMRAVYYRHGSLAAARRVGYEEFENGEGI